MTSDEVAEGNRTFLYLLALFAVAAVILVTDFVIEPTRFSDYSTYLLYLDELAYYRSRDWYQFEPLSKTLLMALRWLARSTSGAIDLAHWLLGGAYIALTAIMLRRERATWQSVLLTFAILGPLLAFVTIRATPAYFLVAIASLMASRGEWRALLPLFAALLFHVSAAFAVLPILIAIYQHRLPALFSAQNRRAFIGVVVLLLIVFAFAGDTILRAITDLVRQFSYLGKYTVYLGAEQANGPAVATETSVYHYFFLAFACCFMAGFALITSERSRMLLVYVASSFMIYVFAFFVMSPVAAFRQTPFWMLPALVVFPWRKLGPPGLWAPILIAFAVLAFGLQLESVYQ